MRLTKQTNYAVLALIYCATAEPALSRVTDIAARFRISEPFLFKIITPLIESGMLESVRGRRGGIRLGRPAHNINLADVVTLTDDSLVLFEEVAAGGDIRREMTGGYADALDGALAAFLAVLGQYSIADLARNEGLRTLLGLNEPSVTPSLLSFRRRPKPA
jgi:Rrf2 family iron-responsive transcriptional regulator